MTENKQIMIDGVDVSTCSERGETINGITCGNGERIRLASEIITKHKLCKDSPNCAYKQLAHKTQECEELKRQLERKEANYQKLLNKSNKHIHNLVDENVQDISNLGKQLNQLKSANEQAEQKLERIRQMLKNGVKIHDDIIVNKSILQIIDEVK